MNQNLEYVKAMNILINKKARREQMTSEAQKRASKRYDAKNTKLLNIKLNLNTDADILEHLASLENKQGYIKSLIRKDIEEKNETR